MRFLTVVNYAYGMSYEQVEASFVSWANKEPNIRAAIVNGSRARSYKPADEWSDLDIILFTTTPDAYSDNTGWLSEMGDIWLMVKTIALEASPEWLVIYEGGVRVDYQIEPATGTLRQLVQRPIYEPALRRGYRILFDKDESGAETLSYTYRTMCYTLPSPAEFTELVTRLLLFAERTARVLCRGELWWAKELCDIKMKECLLQLLEWHACATNGQEHDIWRNGRFLHDWITPDAAAALPATFATYEIADIRRAMLATVDLGCQLARETAEIWRYDYPHQAEAKILDWIHSLDCT
jgi:aminoglycoside 6-adenylyltransferase